MEVAEWFAAFVKSATKTLDVCIYDFRLALPSVRQKVINAIKDASSRGVAVRIAFDANQKSDEEIVKQLSAKGIVIARRTVAKYRSELNILPSHLRKKY